MNKKILSVKKYIFLLAFLGMLIFCTFSKVGTMEVFAFSGTGAGTSNSPYVITTKAQLEEVRNSLASYYKLGNSIDLTNAEWTPIGTNAAPFTGNFDGNNYTISNILINKTITVNDIGFFSDTKNATIKNINLNNINVTSTQSSGQYYYTGGLVGYAAGTSVIQNCSITGTSSVSAVKNAGGLIGNVSSGTVEKCSSSANISESASIGGEDFGGLIGANGANVSKCYATGNVTSSGRYAGGLVGRIRAGNISVTECYAIGKVTAKSYVGGLIGSGGGTTGWTVSNCFALGDVTGDSYVGGLTSYNYNTVTNCYAAGKVNCNGTYSGGFISGGNSATVKNCYFDSVAAGIVPNSAGNVGKLTSAMIAQETYTGWDFTSIWTIDNGSSYPYLTSLPKPSNVNTGLPTNDVSSGIGTVSNPYIISTKEQLNNLRYDMTGYYKLGANIDLQSSSWEPAGTRAVPFTGNFDGNNYTISNLLINKTITINDIGFFSYTNNATIKNINLNNINVTSTQASNSNYYTGGLVGCAAGTSVIQNCSITGTSSVSAVKNAGGLIGYVLSGTVEKCSSSANVSGSASISGGDFGGLIGVNGANVSKCYATGSITASSGSYAGGLVGAMTGSYISVTECYATGNVTAKNYVGGLIGSSSYDGWTVSNCFALGNVTGDEYVGGLTSYVTSITATNCYAAGKVKCNVAVSGGFIGSGKNATVKNCYFDSTNSGFTTPTTQARTTTELMHQATFVNWDFTNIWNIIEGGTYAYLRELPNPHHYVDTQAPTSPQNLKVTSKTINSITLSWDSSTDNIGVAGYKIYRDGKEISIATTNQYTDTGLTPGTAYIYVVKAFDINGNISLPSNQITAVTEYDVPPQLTINLPDRIHIKDTLNISTNPIAVGKLPVVWILQKDGVTVDINSFTVGNLNKDGGSITFKSVGNYTLIANITDLAGKVYSYSDAVVVYNNIPSTPVITMNPATNCVVPGTLVTINAISTDLDGDAITYVWEGRPAEQSTYPVGKNIVKVKAVDSYGAESAWAATAFFVADETQGGGVVLTGPESTIIEEGIEGATITEYTFTVPPVDGHSGEDYGRVRGYSKISGQWEQIALQNTANGITMNGTLSAGIYTKLEFYYYTSHDCMYNKSNITYSVKYNFEGGVQSNAPAQIRYTYAVKSYSKEEIISDLNALESVAIDKALDTQALTIPENLSSVGVTPSAIELNSVVVTSSAIELKWDNATENVVVAGYKIYRNGVEVGTSITANFTDIDIPGAKTYTYTIKAYDATGNMFDESTILSISISGVQDLRVPIVPENITPEQ